MKKLLPIVLIVLSACANEYIHEPENSQPLGASWVDGAVCVKFDEDMAGQLEMDCSKATKSISDALSSLGISSVERVFPDAGRWENRSRKAGLHRWYIVNYESDIPTTKASEDVQDALSGVEISEPVRRMRRRDIFNDPNLKYQWHYINTVSNGADINVKEVWEKYTRGSSDVIVAVVDEGVYLNHDDLAWNAIPAGANGSWNCVRNNSTITTGSGHGTHVAGTIAAVNNNGFGLCGVAGGDYEAGEPGVKILSCQIFDDATAYKKLSGSDAVCARAIKWGADHGAVISQNSWGDEADTDGDYQVSPEELAAFKKRKCPAVIAEAIAYFIEKAGCDDNGEQLEDSPMKGGVVFFAAGNENIDYDNISANEPVIAVGAFGPTGGKASYSNYGSWVDLCAPGGDSDVKNFNIGGLKQNCIYSTVPGNGYAYSQWEGTSMACPHASGVAALVVSYHGGPGFTAEDLTRSMLEGAGSIISNTGKKIDALASLSVLGIDNVAPDRIGTLPDMDVPYGTEVTVDVSKCFSDPNGDALTYQTAGDTEGLDISFSGTEMRIHPNQYGIHDIKIVASDGRRRSRPVNLKVVVRNLQNPDFAVDVYPNPVSRYLYVRGPVAPCDAEVRIVSTSGALIYKDSVSLSLEQPLKINMADAAPGQYSVRVISGGEELIKTIVKI